MFSLAWNVVVALLAFLQPSFADYYIDDTNTTLHYSSGPRAVWGPFAAGGETLELLLPNETYQEVDAYVCYNHTYRYAACFSTDECILTIPFTGSGITIYVYQAGPAGLNVSFAIDDSPTQIQTLSAPPAPDYLIPDVSILFEVQQLPSGPHTASLAVNNFSDSFSAVLFDYAHVNETLFTETTIPTSITSSASSSGSQAAIVGGTLGGVVLVIGGIVFFFFRRKKRAKADRHAPYDPLRPKSQRAFNSGTGHLTTQILASQLLPPLVPNRRRPSVEQIA
ncbi:hypothetical protein V8B97DRAFT_1946266 [Scleroderma yunnanense]